MTVETIRTELAQQLNQYTHRLPKQWWQWLIAPVIAALQLWMYYPFPATHKINSDPATFFYGGNLLARGYPPYLYLWDVKPPLIYDTTALIALLAKDSPFTQFYLGSILTSIMAAGTILLAGAVVYRITQHNIAALVTAVTILAYPYFIVLPSRGVWPKFFALFFGVLGLYLALTNRHLSGVAAATLAPGYWQFGAIFLFFALVLAWRANASVPTALGVSVGVTALTLAPIVLLGATKPMIEQAVLVPLSMGDQSGSLLARVQKFRRIVSYSWPVFYGATLCAGYYVTQRRGAWWLGVGLGWSLLQIGRLDFDSSPDPLMFVVFAAIGMGLFVGTLTQRQQLGIALAICTLAAGQFYPHRGEFVGPPETEGGEKPVQEHFIGEQYPPSTCLITYGGLPLERRQTDLSLPQTCENARGIT